MKDLIEKIIRVSYLSKEGHIPSSLSILQILDYLYTKRLTKWDQFVLSKGHGSLALYAILLKIGAISEQDFFSFCSKDSKLGGHPSSKKINLIESVLLSTGSLGHGLPFCVGLALAKKIKNEEGNVYCLIGDGEANEGTTWESALIASTYNLGNLICIMDFNKSGERAIKFNNCVNKFSSFGWKTYTTHDGNNKSCIKYVFSELDYEKEIKLSYPNLYN
jgi:transketolase